MQPEMSRGLRDEGVESIDGGSLQSVYGTKGREVSDADMPVRMLSERQAFRAARYFLEQFNEREGSDALALFVGWMIEQDESLASADPAQWHDWVQVVDHVLAESDG